MKKNLFLRLCLMTIALLSLPSCRQDILHEKETYHNTSAFQLTSKRISLDEAQHKVKLLPELKKAEAKFKEKSSAFGKTVNYGNGVSIDTDDVIYIENGPNFHTYTFNIKRANAPETAPLENLLLIPETDGSYKEFLVTYNFTPQEREKIRNREPLDTKGKTTITELAKGSFNSDGQLAKMICNWTEETIWQNCSEGIHNASNLDQWHKCKAETPPSVYTIITGGCNIEELPEYIAPVDGGSGPGGGAGGNGPDPCTSVASGLGQVGIIDSNGCSPGAPTQPNDVRPTQTPCVTIKKSTTDAKYKAHVETLKTQGGLTYEVGYKLSYPVPNSGQSGTQDQVLQNKPGTNRLDFTPTNYNFAFLHSHHDKLYPIFSPDDLVALNIWIKGVIDYNNNPSNLPKINLRELTISVVTLQGTYLISFDGTSIDPYPNYTQTQFDRLIRIYESLMMEAGSSYDSDYMDKLETKFLKFTQQYMPMPGMKLFKVESDGNTEIYLDNGNRRTKKCPQ